MAKTFEMVVEKDQDIEGYELPTEGRRSFGDSRGACKRARKGAYNRADSDLVEGFGLRKKNKWSSKANRSDYLKILPLLAVLPAQRLHVVYVRRSQPADEKQRKQLVLREMHICNWSEGSRNLFLRYGLGQNDVSLSERTQYLKQGSLDKLVNSKLCSFVCDSQHTRQTTSCRAKCKNTEPAVWTPSMV